MKTEQNSADPSPEGIITLATRRLGGVTAETAVGPVGVFMPMTKIEIPSVWRLECKALLANPNVPSISYNLLNEEGALVTQIAETLRENIAMITPEALDVFCRFGGNSEHWVWAGTPNKDVISDKVWSEISELIQELTVVKRGFANEQYASRIQEKLKQNSVDQRVAQKLWELA